MKTLKPIRHRESYTTILEREINDYFRDVLITPIRNLLEDAGLDTRENAQGDAVAAALKSGRIWYADGKFSGTFNAAIAKELRAAGATFDPNTSTYSLAPSALPDAIRGAAGQSIARSLALHTAIGETLAQIQTNAPLAPTGLAFAKPAATIAKDLQDQFSDTIVGMDAITVPWEMTEQIAKNIATELTTSLELPINTFLQEQVKELREMVQRNAYEGGRPDKLVDIIEARFGVTRRKAAFLADNEASLLVSKYREQRYRAIGVRSYIWSTSHDERVRDDHKVLNQTQHSWDSPPITNRRTGARNHPGEDFRCRCVALPVIEAPE